MASRIQDENLNVRLDGASIAGKENFSKRQKKAAIGGRKPLGNISNSLKAPTHNQTLKKENSSKSKCLYKASEKAQTAILSILSEENIAEEGMLHNHQECIKAQKRALSMNEVLLLLDLDDFSDKEVLTLNEMEVMSPPWHFEPLIQDLCPPKPKKSKNSAPSSPEPLIFEYFDMDISYELIEP